MVCLVFFSEIILFLSLNFLNLVQTITVHPDDVIDLSISGIHIAINPMKIKILLFKKLRLYRNNPESMAKEVI